MTIWLTFTTVYRGGGGQKLLKMCLRNTWMALKYLYEVDNNEDIDNSIVKFVPTGDEKILKVLSVEKPTPTPAPSIKTTPKPVVEIKSKR